jgi:protein-S-isoprenylcysteine O-methyltransferase Ste14
VHIACLQFEARCEEIYLLGKHGHAYADYMKRVGRFLPRSFSLATDESSSR